MTKKDLDTYISDVDSVSIQGITFYRNTGDSDAKSESDRLSELLQEAQGYKEKYLWLCNLIREEFQDALELHENMKDQGLTAGSIEAEGYVRAWSAADDLIKYVEENS